MQLFLTKIIGYDIISSYKLKEVNMKITQLVSNFLNSNTFIVEKDDEVLIIDCGCEVETVKQIVGDKKVLGLLLTHGHFDHAINCNDYAKCFDCKIYASDKIEQTLTNTEAFYSGSGLKIDDLSAFKFIKQDGILKLGGFEIGCYSFPGHCPCCEGYVIEDNLFAGDFLFAKSFGRVDLVNSSKTDMLQSFEKMKKIEFDKVYSGHGEGSTKDEQLRNLKLYKRFLTR